MITSELMQQFDECLKKYCPFVYKYYNDPLPMAGIEYFMQDAGLDIHSKKDFKTIYQWKNGINIEVQDYSIDLRINSVGNFLSLKDVKPVSETNNPEYGWRTGLVPFMANYEGEYLLIETDRNSSEYEMIFFYSPNLVYAVDTISSYDNLASMLSTIIKLFEEEAQVYNEQKKLLEFDFDKVYEISHRLNPKSEHWRS